ncbi:MAG: hypothetical protein JO332_05435 [Planctomycetaceae bacterium]|nr:hypothetical protein [Planctomycetaceae bacterium]
MKRPSAHDSPFPLRPFTCFDVAWFAAYSLCSAAGGYFFAGTKIWVGSVIGIGGLFGIAGLALRKEYRRYLRFLLVLGLFAFCCGGTGLLFLRSRVFFDNSSIEDVSIRIPGHGSIELERGRTTVCYVRVGTYNASVRTLDESSEYESLPISIGRWTDYVFNVEGAMTYYWGEVIFGERGESWGERGTADRWFPVDVRYAFVTPPESIEVPRGQKREVRTYIRRKHRLDSEFWWWARD